MVRISVVGGLIAGAGRHEDLCQPMLWWEAAAAGRNWWDAVVGAGVSVCVCARMHT